MKNTICNIGNSEITRLFFKNCPSNQSLCYCRNNTCKQYNGRKLKPIKQTVKRGYTNLGNLLRVCVGENFEDIYRNHLAGSRKNLDKYCYSPPRDHNVRKTLEWVVMHDQPLYKIYDPLTSALFNMQPISFK